MRPLILASSLLLTSAVPTSATGPKRKPAGPETAAKASFEAAKKLDWKRYAELLHPESLAEFRGMFVPVLKAAAKKGPREQADLLAMFDGAKDVKTVLAWEPKELFVRLMTGLSAKAPLKETFAGTTANVLGTVAEGADQAHVVLRITRKMGKVELSKVDVVTLKRSRGEWKVMLPGELRGVAETIKMMSGPATSTTREDAVPAERE
jgi:hypothetical protein